MAGTQFVIDQTRHSATMALQSVTDSAAPFATDCIASFATALAVNQTGCKQRPCLQTDETDVAVERFAESFH